MSGYLMVHGLAFSPADARARDGGLLGFLSFEHGSLRIDGVTLRRTRAGRLELSFPERERRGGKRKAIVHPVSLEARRQIEADVLAALRSQYGLAPEGEVNP